MYEVSFKEEYKIFFMEKGYEFHLNEVSNNNKWRHKIADRWWTFSTFPDLASMLPICVKGYLGLSL